MFYLVQNDGFVFSSGKSMDYFPRGKHSLVLSRENLLSLPDERLRQIMKANSDVDLCASGDLVSDVAELLDKLTLEEIPVAKRGKGVKPGKKIAVKKVAKKRPTGPRVRLPEPVDIRDKLFGAIDALGKADKASVKKVAVKKTAKKRQPPVTVPDKPPRRKNPKIDKNAVITLIVPENPKRPGSKARERFKFYRTGMTVAEFVDAGGTMGDVYFDLNHGFINVSY